MAKTHKKEFRVLWNDESGRSRERYRHATSAINAARYVAKAHCIDDCTSLMVEEIAATEYFNATMKKTYSAEPSE